MIYAVHLFLLLRTQGRGGITGGAAVHPGHTVLAGRRKHEEKTNVEPKESEQAATTC